MDFGISGKTALVIGGTSNLGRECAEKLAAEKANLLLFSRNQESLDAVAREISSKYDVKVWTVAGDMTKKDDILRLKTEAEAVGGFDILILNSARPPIPMREILEERDDARWNEAYEAQLWSIIMLVREMVPMMVGRGWGRIVAITSASVKQPMPKHALSTVFRAGVTALLKHLANELADKGITVNCVCPASVMTEGLRTSFNLEERARSVPMKRIGTASEFASTVAFFASEHAGFITGVSLQVDGGMNASLI